VTFIIIKNYKCKVTNGIGLSHRSSFKSKGKKTGVVAYICDPSILETEAEGL
jgi:hypothetical protein